MITSKVRPRHLVHRGFVEATGFFFHSNLGSQTRARMRILSLWSPAAKVYRVPDGLILRLAKKQPVYCDRSVGTPLTYAPGSSSETAQTLLATHLEQDELKSLNPRSQTVVCVRDGLAVMHSLDTEEDPASWLDVSAFTALPVRTPPAAATTIPPAAIAPEKIDVRQQLNVPPIAAEMEQMVNQLRARQRLAKAVAAGEPSAWHNFLQWMNTQLLAGAAESGGQSAASTRPGFARSTAAPATVPRKPAAWLIKLKKTMLDLLSATRLLDLFETRQAMYVMRMMDMFERSDWENALKHAIPLGGEGAEALRSLGLPSMRNSLNITLSHAGAASSIHMPSDYFARLKELYRAAFNSLSNAGKIDEAAFVLIELLQEPEEGIAYLERHGRIKLAAQLAEARNMRAPLVVRLWFLAGDTERAIAIARLRNAFSEAIALLEKKDPEQAYALRMHWVHYLAESGNYVMAARIAQMELNMNGLARAWVKRAIEAGHSDSGQLLALIWCNFRNEFPELVPQIHALLDDDSREHAAARVAFVQELIKDNAGDADTLVMARQATRAILRDVGAGYINFSKKQFSTLTNYSNDALLWTDLQGAQAPATPKSLQEYVGAISIVLKAGDVGAAALYDAVILPNGRAFLALGEAGVYLVSQGGSLIKHFHAPADYLIESDHGDRVLAVVARGKLKRLTRIDALSGKADDLGEFRFDHAATSYNGSTWYAACEDQFLVMDGASDRCKLLWVMPNVTGVVESIVRGAASCTFIVRSRSLNAFGQPMPITPLSPEKWDRWYCDEPGSVLRQRLPINSVPPEGTQLLRLSTPSGKLVEIGTRVVAEPIPSALHKITMNLISASVLQIPSRDPAIRTAISDEWLAVVADATCYLIALRGGKTVAKIDLLGSTGIVARLNDRHLVLCDSAGRVLAIDLKTGQIVRSLRIM